ncbi:MAG TPA: hypothetical protein VGX21_17560 [Methylomirabilota bacterium]|nr:hypothetical protein [Methylomirabilota bacterium]
MFPTTSPPRPPNRRNPGLPPLLVALILALALPAAAAAQTIRRVSVATDGSEAQGATGYHALSADGRIVVFVSGATNLVPDCTGGVYVHDRASGVTTCLGIYISSFPSLSADGRFVAFRISYSSSPSSPPAVQTFVLDRATGTTEMVSVTNDGTPSNGTTAHRETAADPAISADGRVVAFGTDATNLAPGVGGGLLVNVFVRDRVTGQTTHVPGATIKADTRIAISADGRIVAWMGPAFSGPFHIYVHDRVTGETTIAGDGVSPAVSADGRFVTYVTGFSAGDVVVYDRVSGTTTPVSLASGGAPANGSSCPDFFCVPAISGDGRLVAFASNATNLAPDDTNGVTDVFVHDRLTGETRRVSVPAEAGEANGPSNLPHISADGTIVSFLSSASNLVPGDTNGASDLFVVAPDSGGAPPGPANLSVSVAVNQSHFSPGETFVISASVDNRGLSPAVDFYLGVLLPDGETIVFFTGGGTSFGRLSNVATLGPIAARVSLATPFAVSVPNIFAHTWTGSEPPGIYVAFLAVVMPGAFADGTVDPGDVLALSLATFSFGP